jgi:hypothetical protein
MNKFLKNQQNDQIPKENNDVLMKFQHIFNRYARKGKVVNT